MTDHTATPTDADEPERPLPAEDPRPPVALVEDELLVEDVSIDGMCGVY
jgi:mycofactocin precursor